MAQLEDEVPPSPRPLPDLIGGRYRIVSRLGVGGMGVVYKATDIQLNRSVAIKALEERRLHLPGASARLKTEALAAASLDHPYICKVYELVETPTDVFIVMEYVEGETLASMLKRGVLPLLQTLQLGREIAEGLANAHNRGLVHRDVKPSNVMVTTHGHVKLLDFGVAGADVESTSKDITRTLSPQVTVHAGTPQYMAPEQAAGNPITTRADLFSLGVVLYECLTAKLPFSGSTTFDYVRHVMQSPPKRLDKVAPETPSDLVDLIDRLLEKTPADRPESADAVVKRLRQFEDALTAPTGDLRTARQARAGRRWKWLAAAAVVLAVIASTWRFILPQTAPEDVPRQLRPFVTTSAVESGSRISPDGQWVSFISRAGGVSRIMVQRIDGGEPRPLTLTPGQPLSQLWSPDSGQIAGVLRLDNSFALQVYPAFFGGVPVQSIALGEDLNTAELVRWIGLDVFVRVQARRDAAEVIRQIPLDAPASARNISDAWKVDGTIRGVDIRPDGRSAVIAVSKDSQEHLWTVNIDGSSLRQLTSDSFFHREPLWVGSTNRVMFQSNRGGQVDLWQIDVDSKVMTPLTSGEGEEIPESSSADGTNLSFRQLTTGANLWTIGAAGSQITQDSLSDYTPVLSADGKALAFQRSQPTPSRGYTILDAKVFVAPFDGKPVLDPQSVGDGFAPDLSHDGQWLAYLQMGDRPTRMKLSVRDMRGGGTILLTSHAALPSLALTPVEWSARTTAWSRTGQDLFFVEVGDGESDAYAIRKYRGGQASAGRPIAHGLTPDSYIRNLYVSPQTGRLAYLSGAREIGSAIHELDPDTGAVRIIARFAPKQLVGFLRGWLDRSLVLVRTGATYEDRTSDNEIQLVDGAGNIRTVGRVTRVFSSTMRVDASKRLLYMTRSDAGTRNVFAFSFDTGTLTAVTQNSLPGVTFSGFHPFGTQGLLGVREERREDIWLIQQTGTPRTGNPAGR